MYLLGIDLGSSFIKASVIDASTSKVLAQGQVPEKEQHIIALETGWAEQEPEIWWELICELITRLGLQTDLTKVTAIGISYQMHGLVVIDKDLKVLRPAIIWCDSRAAVLGDQALEQLGSETCMKHLLNSPGNFTASKLKWVQLHEPELYARIYKFMLPGDFIAMKLSGLVQTTAGGLSEAILWDYPGNVAATLLLSEYGLNPDLIPTLVPAIGYQAPLSPVVANRLGLNADAVITYRAGDQPNNALSLNVFEPGEVAATAGTSAVIYAVHDHAETDALSRINTFLHVNHTAETPRYGSLLCINGSGILYSWLKTNTMPAGQDYARMNELAESVGNGAAGLMVLPFGNGAERVLENKAPGASFHNLSLTRHTSAHMARAAIEGIVFSLKYGLDILEAVQGKARVIRAGHANLFLSDTFARIFATVMDTRLELYRVDGAQGAARAAGLGSGFYKTEAAAFGNLQLVKTIDPDPAESAGYKNIYSRWKELLYKEVFGNIFTN